MQPGESVSWGYSQEHSDLEEKATPQTQTHCIVRKRWGANPSGKFHSAASAHVPERRASLLNTLHLAQVSSLGPFQTLVVQPKPSSLLCCLETPSWGPLCVPSKPRHKATGSHLDEPLLSPVVFWADNHVTLGKGRRKQVGPEVQVLDLVHPRAAYG